MSTRSIDLKKIQNWNEKFVTPHTFLGGKGDQPKQKLHVGFKNHDHL